MIGKQSPRARVVMRIMALCPASHAWGRVRVRGKVVTRVRVRVIRMTTRGDSMLLGKDPWG